MSGERKRGLIGGIAGGIVGGIVMMVLLVAAAMMMGMPPLTMFAVMGAAFGGSAGAGMALHFLTSIVLGAIFGLGVTSVRILHPSRAGRSSVLGVLYGAIVFLVLFVPLAMLAFGPAMVNLIQMMAPASMPMSQAAAAEKAQSLMPMVLGIGFVGHVLFGLIVGLSVYLTVRPVLAAHVHTHDSDEEANYCPACKVSFESEDKLNEHKHTSHAM